MPRRHFLPLEDHFLARLEIVVEGDFGFGGRGEGKAKRGAFIFRADSTGNIAHGGARPEGFLRAVAPVPCMNGRAILAEGGPDEPILQHMHRLDRAARHFIHQHLALLVSVSPTGRAMMR